MTHPQVAWSMLTAVFVISGAAACFAPYEPSGFAWTCLAIGIIGWLMLTYMILADRRP